MYDCVIIGGGAAGLFAATLFEPKMKIALVNHHSTLGKKLSITGKGRCNLTNACDRDTFFQNIRKNPKFLYSAFSEFSNYDTMSYFEDAGVKLKIERGDRVFPESDKADDIVNALVRKVCARKTDIIKASVSSLFFTAKGDGSGNFCIKTSKGELLAKNVILATGGMSYPVTGSDGSGYALAKAMGHTIIEPTPSLVPVEVDEKQLCRSMCGLSLKNTALKLVRNGSIIYEDFGEMLFTPYGLTGPMILSMSPFAQKGDSIVLDLKPALDEKQLDRRLLSDFDKYINKNFSNALNDLLPSKMIEPFIRLTGIDPLTKVNSITKEQRKIISDLLKGMTFTMDKHRPIAEAIVTAGGVSVKEINPKTMESKLVEGLYFAGEMIDVDAYTGGFNLQVAFSTAYCAAKSISEKILYYGDR